jgi:hypothetical protein
MTLVIIQAPHLWAIFYPMHGKGHKIQIEIASCKKNIKKPPKSIDLVYFNNYVCPVFNTSALY